MRIVRPLVMLVAAASFVAAYWFGTGWQTHETPEKNEPKPTHQVIEGLAVENATLDLGEVWETKALLVELAIHNQSNQEIVIADFAMSCSCIDVEPRSLTIGAGKTTVTHLTFDLTE